MSYLVSSPLARCRNGGRHLLPMSEFASEPRCSRTRATRSAPAPLRPVRFPEPRAQGHRGRAATLLPRIVVAPACPEAPQSAPFSAALFRAFVGYAACPEAPRSTPCADLFPLPSFGARVPEGHAVGARCATLSARPLLASPRAQRHRGRRPCCPSARRAAYLSKLVHVMVAWERMAANPPMGGARVTRAPPSRGNAC